MVDGKGPIGMLDSGVGGLTVAREVVRFIPEAEIVYFGDTLHLPYGPRGKDEVRQFVFQIIDFLIKEKGARAVILACNTATAFTLEEASRRYTLPVFGTLTGASKRAVEITTSGRIGVIGTVGTISSQAFQKKLKQLSRETEVLSAACPRFVELVEEGRLTGKVVTDTARHYLKGLKGAGVDTLILGCTHFPYLMPVIQQVMGPEVTLINPGTEVAREVREILGEWEMEAPEKGPENTVAKISRQEFLVSDLSRVSETFLKEGSKYLQLPELRFREKNIFRD